jgi:sortase B
MIMKMNGWNLAAGLARGGDWVLNKVIGLLLIVALLYSSFGLWDTWQIYHSASLDSDLLKYKPTVTTDGDAQNPTLLDLQKINEDVCGWITVDGTKIDYPVLQGETNVDYLNQSVDHSFALSGSIFLDCRNDRNFTEFYSLIYGHHMSGNVMFGEIPNFLGEEYFQSHTTGALCTPEHSYYITWFACVKTTAYDARLFSPALYTSQELREELLEYIKETATQYRDISVTASDQIVALSTCEDATTDGRVMLIGRMSRGVQK